MHIRSFKASISSSGKRHKLGSALWDPFKVTLENWIFLRNGHLIDTVCYLKVTLENWIFFGNGYLIDTVYYLKDAQGV